MHRCQVLVHSVLRESECSLLRGVSTERGGLAIVHIDASKGVVDLWVHLTFAIFANFDFKKMK